MNKPLFVPLIDEDADSFTIARALAEAGFYVLPTRNTGDAKHAGSVLGTGWPAKSSRDPEQIRDWFANTDHRVAIHCGRSGLIVADVDDPDKVTPELATAVAALKPPFQSTREEQPRRGHYLFAQPPGRRIGNRAGETGREWGEWRGDNGIILVGGPGRVWRQTEEVPELPRNVSDLLPDVGDTASAVGDAEIERFVAEHKLNLSAKSLDAIIAGFNAEVDAGASRHVAATGAACWVVREAMEGRFPARTGLRRLADEFVAALTETGRDGRAITRPQAENEFESIVGWAVAQEWRPGTPGISDETTPPAEDPTAGVRERARQIQVDLETERLRIKEQARQQLDAERLANAPAVEDVVVWDDALETLPPPRMLVTRLIPACAVGWLGGPSGSYKSFVGVGITASIAYGVPALEGAGLTPREQLKVLYVAAEGSSGVGLRLRAVRRRLDITATRGVALYPRAFDLGSPADTERMIRFALANRIGFIVVDTWRQTTVGVEENDNTAVGIVMRRLIEVRDEHGIGSLLIDHTNKSAQGLADLGGAGAKRANADYVLMIDLPNGNRDADQQRTLRVAKFKDAPDGETWPIRLARVPEIVDEDGVPAAVAIIGAVAGAEALLGDRGGDWWTDLATDSVPEQVARLTGRGSDAARDVYRVLAFIGDREEGSTRGALIRAVNAAPGRDYSDSSVDRGLRMLRDDAQVIANVSKGRFALSDQHLHGAA
ncbi:AAA family ATPase [Pseudonocardia parietis]|uniref:DNA primase/polymerase bifunctional N-terminal domain-containing protein n=1 Tax=Pseudonocardia parietis TaxID=570936 RepID=A0ABS4W3A8_9PSEU|nr:AAA family ATPase [Pseudonocardia parietis]MBP2370693.1 hypothetical protein [Pseudonocardia parietis]